MKKWMAVLAIIALSVAPLAFAEEEEKKEKANSPEEKRAQTDEVADEALETLFSESDKAAVLFEKAYGWAVFDNLKIQFILSGGGGAGVAVNKMTGQRTYMKMGTGGIGLGLGGQKYQVVFFFEDEQTFTNFVEKGWKAETSAQASAGTAGANVGANFTNGMAVYQMTEAGLMASADINGTKYWKNKKLNEE